MSRTIQNFGNKSLYYIFYIKPSYVSVGLIDVACLLFSKFMILKNNISVFTI